MQLCMSIYVCMYGWMDGCVLMRRNVCLSARLSVYVCMYVCTYVVRHRQRRQKARILRVQELCRMRHSPGLWAAALLRRGTPCVCPERCATLFDPGAAGPPQEQFIITRSLHPNEYMELHGVSGVRDGRTGVSGPLCRRCPGQRGDAGSVREHPGQRGGRRGRGLLHTYTDIHACMQIYAYIHRYIHACMHADICVHTYTIHAYIHTHRPPSIHTYRHTDIHAYMQIYAYIHAYIHTHRPPSLPPYIHTYIHTYTTDIHAQQTYMHACMQIYAYIHTYIHTCIHT